MKKKVSATRKFRAKKINSGTKIFLAPEDILTSIGLFDSRDEIPSRKFFSSP